MFAVDDLKILLTSVGENDLTFSPAFWFVSSDSLRFGGRVDVTMLRWLVGEERAKRAFAMAKLIILVIISYQYAELLNQILYSHLKILFYCQ